MLALNNCQQKQIVSIQSQVICGSTGNTVAVPLMQMLDVCVYAVPTVLLSDTLNHPMVAIHEIPAHEFNDILERLLEHVSAYKLDAILTGYIPSIAIAEVAASFIDKAISINPEICVCVNPVLSDSAIRFTAPTVMESALIEYLLPRADICTPNLFEASRLTGLDISQPDEILIALQENISPIGVLSGIGLNSALPRMDTIAWNGEYSIRQTSSRLKIRPTGTGDILTAAFLTYYLKSASVKHALQRAVSIVNLVLNLECAESGSEYSFTRDNTVANRIH